MSDKQVWLLFSRSRSQGSQIRLWLFLLYLLNFWYVSVVSSELLICFCCIFWTSVPFATNLCWMVHYHKSDCLAKWLDCGVRVKATGNCQNFIDCQLYIFSIKIVLWWSQTKVKFTVKVDKTKRKIVVPAISSELLLQWNLVWWVYCNKVKLCSKWRSQWRFRASLDLCHSVLFSVPLLSL